MPRPFPSDIYVGKRITMNCGSTFEVKNIKSSLDIELKSIDTGFEVSVVASQIFRRSVKDPEAPVVHGVGCVGFGIYRATTKNGNNSNKTKAYMKWNAMMERCYSDKLHARNPCYKDCEVCEEWQNFQNFAEWYYENCPDQSMDLDKDLITPGNRIYSPEKCSFISSKQNKSIIKRSLRPVSITNGYVNLSFDSIANAGRFINEHYSEKNAGASIHGLLTGKRHSVKGWVLA